MKFLLDTNVVIQLEPTRSTELEPTAKVAAEFARLVQQSGHQFFLHPAIQYDFARDLDAERRALRDVVLGKYPTIAQPPPTSLSLVDIFGNPPASSNDWVDMQIVAAVEADAVDYVVTDDQHIHRRAIRADLGDRILTVPGALATLRGLEGMQTTLPPHVERVPLYTLSSADPIFDSLRTDYPQFDKWLQKAKREHRQAWVIRGSQGALAALCIFKDDTGTNEYAIKGKVFKLATFKVSEHYQGLRYGELLLKAVFAEIEQGNYDHAYVTIFEKHEPLIGLFMDFGFDELKTRSKLDELVLHKPLRWRPEEYGHLPPIEFHRKFGPRALKATDSTAFVVPIRPEYHQLLFPDADPQRSLLPGQHPFGNALRKAYLCNAPTRQIQPGSILLFYRSVMQQAVRVVGVAEKTIISDDPKVIARFVGRRTVYSFSEIQKLAQRPILAILFCQSRVIDAITLRVLITNRVLVAAPQSIVKVKAEAMEWLKQLLEG